MIQDFVHRLRYRFSYSYRVQVGAGVEVVRSKAELKAIIAFCRSELKNKKRMRLNPERTRVYEMTIKLYEQHQGDDKEVYAKIHEFQPVKQPTRYNDHMEFIEDHVGWYWN